VTSIAPVVPTQLQQLQTPCLVLDETRMSRNIERLQGRLRRLGAQLNPHLKTSKCVEVARRLMASQDGPCTVSTLQEAEQFAAAGVTNVLYAVGIAPNKLARVLALRAKGVDVAIVLDNVDQARAVVAAARATKTSIPVLVEIDTDGHRSGVRPDDAQLLTQLARIIHDGGSQIRGVLTHAGDSYNLRGEDALAAIAEQERAGAVKAASILRAGGWECPVVSVGSSPTAHFARDLTGVTEVRAGVFVFFDLVMAGIGVCTVDDIAVSVLASVIGHQRDRGWILIDAGWMAMSRDRGTAKQEVDQGYGVVCDVSGRPYADLIVVDANQEHGIIGVRPSSAAALPDLAVGTLVRILPNHACATGAQHDRYHVVRGESPQVHVIWNRFRGW
jgi:D-serine deaminase-like pyridoxal phosphate-dependent protein